MEELIFSKRLPQTPSDHRLCIPTKKLHMFPPFVEGNNVQSLTLKDMEEEGIVWNFDFYVRSDGHPKPVLAGDWVHFVRRKGLQVGDAVLLCRVIDVNTDVNYKIRPFRQYVKN